MRPTSFSPAIILRSGGAKALAVACALVACEPFIGSCGDSKVCEDHDYELLLFEGNERYTSDSTYIVDSLSFSVRLNRIWPANPTSSLGSGCAYALSCYTCEQLFRADSIFFTTALITVNGDTLPPGLDVSTGNHVGIAYGGGELRIHSIQGFRDSLFEVHYIGRIGRTTKQASVTLHIRNPALLLP
jgi:hypothetical protein